jgi:hypothetical protein
MKVGAEIALVCIVAGYGLKIVGMGLSPKPAQFWDWKQANLVLSLNSYPEDLRQLIIHYTTLSWALCFVWGVLSGQGKQRTICVSGKT